MKFQGNTAECYDGETLGLYVSNELSPEKMSEIACHLTACKRCNAIVRDLADWALAGVDVEKGEVPIEVQEMATRAVDDGKKRLLRREWLRSAWLRVDESFMPQQIYAAAADGQTADQILSATANGSGFVRFTSVEEGDDAWRVRIARLPNPTEESILRIHVEDKDGNPVPSGVLRYHGVPVDVQNGKAYLPIKELRRKAEHMISLQRAGGPEVPGTLVIEEQI